MSTLPPDPYKILGVSKDAQLPEIRSAHRKLVLKCHPDKVQDPKQKEEKQKEFQQVQQAYELLSNDLERQRYDDKVRLEELKRDRGMTSTSTSSPRTSKREHKYYDVREAEPRPSTFASSPSSGSHNVYGHTPPSRSWDEDIYASKRDYEKPRHARKTQSYEYEKPKLSRKEEERLKRKEEDEWAREKEKARAREKDIKEAERQRERDLQRERDALVREREREKDIREKEITKKEKERRKDERKEDKKKSEKERRKESDEKHRRHNKSQPPYVEDIDEVYMSSKPEKKSSSSRKFEEVVSPPPQEASHAAEPGMDRERKYSATMESAIRYLSRSGGNPPAITRAQTFHTEHAFRHINPIAVPTPPPAAGSMFPPPPVADPRDVPTEDDAAKRSSTRARRMSHDTPRSSKEKSSHKKSSSSRDPLIADPSSPIPAARVVPSFQKSTTMPIPIHRSTTEDYPRPPLAPGLERAATWMADGRARDRSHSRHNRGAYMDESSEDDRDRRHRRSRRTQSPDAMPHTHTTKRYTVERHATRAIPVESSYFKDDTPRSSKKAYPSANSSARRADRYYDEFEEEPRVMYQSAKYPEHNVEYSKTFAADDISFSNVQHTPYREEVYT